MEQLLSTLHYALFHEGSLVGGHSARTAKPLQVGGAAEVSI